MVDPSPLAQVLELPDGDRREVVTAVQDSLADPIAFPAEELAMLDERAKDYQAHPDQVLSLEDFRARFLARGH